MPKRKKSSVASIKSVGKVPMYFELNGKPETKFNVEKAHFTKGIHL